MIWEEVFVVDNVNDEEIPVEFTYAHVNVPARMISSPVEMGYNVFDNKVLDPIEITLKCLVSLGSEDIKNAMQTLYSLYAERTYNFCTVATKEGVYNNMSLCDMPHEETTDKHDVIEVTLKFKQVIQAGKQSRSTTSAQYTDMIRRGKNPKQIDNKSGGI